MILLAKQISWSIQGSAQAKLKYHVIKKSWHLTLENHGCTFFTEKLTKRVQREFFEVILSYFIALNFSIGPKSYKVLKFAVHLLLPYDWNYNWNRKYQYLRYFFFTGFYQIYQFKKKNKVELYSQFCLDSFQFWVYAQI